MVFLSKRNSVYKCWDVISQIFIPIKEPIFLDKEMFIIIYEVIQSHIPVENTSLFMECVWYPSEQNSDAIKE